MNSGAVTDALARIFHDGKISQQDVAIGVYGQSVIVRKITVPIMTPSELDEQIHWEAEQHIPFDIKLMSIDYEVPAAPPRGRGRWISPRRRQEGRDKRLRGDSSGSEAPADRRRYQRLHHPEHLRAPVWRAAPGDHRPAQPRRGGLLTQHRHQGRQRGFTPRDHERPGTPSPRRFERHSHARTSRRRQSTAAARRRSCHRKMNTAIINQSCLGLAGEIQQLDFYLATSGEQEISRIVSGGGAISRRSFRRSRRGPASPSSSSIRWSIALRSIRSS